MKVDNTKNFGQIDSNLQHAVNYAEALRQLKHADSLLQQRKKQLRVQAVKAHRGSYIDHQLLQRQKLRQEIRTSNQKMQTQLQNLRVKQMQRIEQYKKRSEKLRQQNYKNREKSRLEVLQSRMRAKHEMRMLSIEHEEKIRRKFNQTMHRKKSLCQDIYNSRKLSKANLDSLQQSRMVQIRKGQSRQRDQLVEKLKAMHKQLNQLDQSTYVLTEGDRKNEHSTADVTSLRKSQLPYKQSGSSYLKRRKSNSESKMDSNRHQLLILS